MRRYDDDADRVSGCRKCALADLTRLEVGAEPSKSSMHGVNHFFKASPKRSRAGGGGGDGDDGVGGVGGGGGGGGGDGEATESDATSSSSSTATSTFLMRLHLTGGGGDVLQFRSTRLRFFNNMAVPICKTLDMNGEKETTSMSSQGGLMAIANKICSRIAEGHRRNGARHHGDLGPDGRLPGRAAGETRPSQNLLLLLLLLLLLQRPAPGHSGLPAQRLGRTAQRHQNGR